MSSDHTEAATITPEAKPSRTFCKSSGMSFFMKKTKADPRAVPRKGISRARKVLSIFTISCGRYNKTGGC